MWEVHEQAAVAAMEAGCKELALKLVNNCHKKFPTGARATRLAVRAAPPLPVLGGRHLHLSRGLPGEGRHRAEGAAE